MSLNLTLWTNWPTVTMTGPFILLIRLVGSTCVETPSQERLELLNDLWPCLRTSDNAQYFLHTRTRYNMLYSTSRLKMIKVVGKRNRIVPAILTEDMVLAMNTLVGFRAQVGISEKNPYFFANPSAKRHDTHIGGWDALNSTVLDADLQRPDLITSTKIRKYCATVSQVSKWFCLIHSVHDLVKNLFQPHFFWYHTFATRQKNLLAHLLPCRKI